MSSNCQSKEYVYALIELTTKSNLFKFIVSNHGIMITKEVWYVDSVKKPFTSAAISILVS